MAAQLSSEERNALEALLNDESREVLAEAHSFAEDYFPLRADELCALANFDEGELDYWTRRGLAHELVARAPLYSLDSLILALAISEGHDEAYAHLTAAKTLKDYDEAAILELSEEEFDAACEASVEELMAYMGRQSREMNAGYHERDPGLKERLLRLRSEKPEFDAARKRARAPIHKQARESALGAFKSGWGERREAYRALKERPPVSKLEETATVSAAAADASAAIEI